MIDIDDPAVRPDRLFLNSLVTLAPLERQIIVLVYFGQQTQRQVAELLSISRASVAQAVSTGLRALAALIEGNDLRDPRPIIVLELPVPA